MDEKMSKKWEKAAERAERGDFNSVNLQEGTNMVKLYDEQFEEAYIHYVTDVDGNIRRVVCPAGLENRKSSHERCVICKEFKETKDTDLRPQHRYFFNALQGTLDIEKRDGKKVKVVRFNDGTVRIWEFGAMIFKQLHTIHSEGDFGEIQDVFLKVVKKGEKLNTEYKVIPSPKKYPLPDDMGEPNDLAELVVLTPEKEVYEIMGMEDDYEGEDEDEDEGEKRKSKSKSKSKSRKRTNDNSDMELDEEDLDDLDEEDLDDLDE